MTARVSESIRELASNHRVAGSRALSNASKFVIGCVLALAIFTPRDGASASGFNVLYTFTGGNDGGNPLAGLIDIKGNFYGTTQYGGTNNAGTVFKLAPDGTETVLYSFTGGNDGGNPYARLIKDAAGNFYGTASSGGVNNEGTVFKVAPDGTETVLYSFTGGNDGGYPEAGLVKDAAGNLYGTTVFGGAGSAGTVFKVAPDRTETVLHSFTGGSDGIYPVGGLIRIKHNLYGTTFEGGASNAGTVFKITSDGKEKVLYSFTGGSDGGNPLDSLIKDAAGTLYGTTGIGGNTACDNGGYGCGTVFKIAPDGIETVLYSFGGGNDGLNPFDSLIMDEAGNLYGTTNLGGTSNDGIVFKVAPDGTETVLHSFKGGNDGRYPWGGLIANKKGHLFGTTQEGGADDEGTVFELKE